MSLKNGTIMRPRYDAILTTIWPLAHEPLADASVCVRCRGGAGVDLRTMGGATSLDDPSAVAFSSQNKADVMCDSNVLELLMALSADDIE